MKRPVRIAVTGKYRNGFHFVGIVLT